MLSPVTRPRSPPSSEGTEPVGGFKCGRGLIRLAFWKEDFGQGEDSLGWGKRMEPAAFSRPEAMVVRIGAGMLELESRQN